MRFLKGPLIILLIIFLVAFVLRWFKPSISQKFSERKQAQVKKQTPTPPWPSDVIRLAGDGYLGYWFITSPDMEKEALKSGLKINFTDDGGAYAQRLQEFNSGKYDGIVLPINSYLQHGLPYKFPGVIIATISESKGADAIVGFSEVAPNGRISRLNDLVFEVVYTADSPSSFLLDLIIKDFDLYNLRYNKSWRVELKSSEEVYERAVQSVKAVKSGKERVGDAFVMWEPQVSMAIEKLGLNYIWGSDKFKGYIVDVFVFNRDFVKNHPEQLKKFFTIYFSTMDSYFSDEKRMIEEMAKSLHFDKEVVQKMVKKIDWYNLQRNCVEQFGIALNPADLPKEGVFNSIIACSGVLFGKDQIDAKTIIDNAIIKKLSPTFLLAAKKIEPAAPAVVKDFASVDWSTLKEVGKMRADYINFQRGSSELDDLSKDAVSKVAGLLINNYPNFRVSIRGHTGPGDREANRQLSLERARAVMQYFITKHRINPNRLQAAGLADTQPPPLEPGEDYRALRLRMPRVEFILVGENN